MNVTRPAEYVALLLGGGARRRGRFLLPATEEQQMTERVVLITGALAGIGRATATAFAREGAVVVVSGRRDEEGKALAAELRELGAAAEYIRADVSVEDDVTALVDATIGTFGQLDVAVNNAGFTGNRGPLATQTLEAYNAVFDTNVRGVFFSLKHELRVMTRQGFGSIVNLSSTFGERGGAGAALYSASKHAVNGFTRSAALEVAAQGIRVNAVAPGPVATDGLGRFAGGAEAAAAMAATVPAGRLGHVDEIADVITFLASDKARFLTGQIVAVNGGKTAA
jgi:NAD(P)-dependent dehydrogenase (short-subunit alcohol dehydrogenase family)